MSDHVSSISSTHKSTAEVRIKISGPNLIFCYAPSRITDQDTNAARCTPFPVYEFLLWTTLHFDSKIGIRVRMVVKSKNDNYGTKKILRPSPSRPVGIFLRKKNITRTFDELHVARERPLGLVALRLGSLLRLLG